MQGPSSDAMRVSRWHMVAATAIAILVKLVLVSLGEGDGGLGRRKGVGQQHAGGTRERGSRNGLVCTNCPAVLDRSCKGA